MTTLLLSLHVDMMIELHICLYVYFVVKNVVAHTSADYYFYVSVSSSLFPRCLFSS